jgi:glycerol uptake facilitator-like aquaporin
VREARRQAVEQLTLIFTFGPISGAHFNPAVSLAALFEGGLEWRRVPGYIVAQLADAIAGVVAAHAMFEHPLLVLSHHARIGFAQLFSEFLATFGLLVVIHGTGKRAAVVPLTVAAYITAAYWFTSSTSFANPAVTIARGLTDTFSGIEAAGIPGFIVAQLLGALAATLLFRWIGNGKDEHSLERS